MIFYNDIKKHYYYFYVLFYDLDELIQKLKDLDHNEVKILAEIYRSRITQMLENIEKIGVNGLSQWHVSEGVKLLRTLGVKYSIVKIRCWNELCDIISKISYEPPIIVVIKFAQHQSTKS